MSDDPNGGGGEPDPVAARTSDDSTLEMQAVPQAPEPEPENVDAEMLAAFLGSSEEVAESADEADVLTGAPIGEVPDETDVLTGAPIADAVLIVEQGVADEAVDDAPESDASPSKAPVAEKPVAAEQSEAGTADGPVSHAAPRRSAWPTVLTIAGIVVALGAVGAGGVYVGRMTASTTTAVVPSDPAAAEQTGASAPMAVGPLPVPAPGTFLVTTARVPTSTWPVVLTAAEALPDDIGTAPGYRLVNAGISGGQVASILATTFGATGSVVEADGTWTVGEDGEPQVVVTSDSLFSWSFADPAALALPATEPALDPADAISATTEALAGIGVDISTVEYAVDTTDGRTGVSAWQLVGEQRTQLGWRLVFDSDGSILAASGFSSGLEGVPDYPVVGAATAVSRSQQSPWTALPASPITGPVDTTGAATPSAAATGVPTVDVPMSTVSVVSAELGLAQYWQPDGSVLLLPSYILTGVDGSTWSLLAVADAAVTFVDQPFPSTGLASGFVAGPFPSAAPDESVLDESVPDDALVGEDPGFAEDSGVVDENGDVTFDPSQDPAAGE